MEREIIRDEGPRADLTRLNAAEVQVLQLLAGGHTAKSIANLTGRSVASVNERLRQSRLKTGVSSSRELARALRAQENGDERIELAGQAIAEPDRRRFTMGVMLMGTLMFAAALAAAVQPTSNWPEPAFADKDPVLKGVLGSAEDHPFRLAQMIRAEQRDKQWADRLEASLRERFSSLAGDGRVALIKVSCARTICEVVGKIDERDREVASKTVSTLQDAPFNAVAADAKHAGIAFGPEGFASYWKRS